MVLNNIKIVLYNRLPPASSSSTASMIIYLFELYNIICKVLSRTIVVEKVEVVQFGLY